jgi:hypothetical protein
MHYILIQFKVHVIGKIILQYPIENNDQKKCQENDQYTAIDNAQPVNLQCFWNNAVVLKIFHAILYLGMVTYLM